MTTLPDRLFAADDVLRVAKVGCACNANGADVPILAKLEAVRATVKEAAAALSGREAVGHDYRAIAHLIGSIFYAGNFKAETANERTLESLLRDVGTRYASWEEVEAGEAGLNAISTTPQPGDGVVVPKIACIWSAEVSPQWYFIADLTDRQLPNDEGTPVYMTRDPVVLKGSPETVPDGMVQVPREPTAEMIEAGNALWKWPVEYASAVYAAMIAAAPSAKGGAKAPCPTCGDDDADNHAECDQEPC